MKLRGIEFGNVFCAPGALNFFGEGYPFHRVAAKFGMNWEGTGFVSKTIVVPPRGGNMPLRENLAPKERLLPKSIVVKFRSGHVLNAVGLSGPGIVRALATELWQQRTDAFMISFMSVAQSPDERLAETKRFVQLLLRQLPSFRGKLAIQANRACPNSGHPPDDFYVETAETLDILGALEVPVMVNYNPTVPGAVMKATADHEVCDGLWIGNTIAWGDAHINWERIFGSSQSPLTERNLPVPGGGGLSGPACLPHTIERVLEARRLGITKPIVAGNGIQWASDVALVRQAGADAIAIGSVGMVRPWRMRQIITTGNQYQAAADA